MLLALLLAACTVPANSWYGTLRLTMPCPLVPQPGTAKPEASGLRPTDVVSQLDVVRLLAERKDKLNKVMGKTLEELEIFEVSCDSRVQPQLLPGGVVQLSGCNRATCASGFVNFGLATTQDARRGPSYGKVWPQQGLDPYAERLRSRLSPTQGSVFTIHAGKTALEAFHHMAVDHKSCLGIVDDEGRLIGNVSISDLRAVGAGNFALLRRSVAEFVVAVAGKGISQEEVIKGARVPVSNRGAGVRSHGQTFPCRPDCMPSGSVSARVPVSSFLL